MTPGRAFLLLGSCLLFPLGSRAQSPLPVTSAPVLASGENSRLRQMESIYQLQLRNKHIPLLGRYITDLQKLADQAADPAPYQREIARIQTIISSGGVVDLSAAVQSLKTPAETPAQMPPPMPVRVGQAYMALTPALARSISPTPDGSASPEAAAIGEMEWRIESLPAGTYEVVLNYACPALPEPLPLQVTLGGQRLETVLDKDKATTGPATYRLLRLGRLTFPSAVSGENLKLTAGGKTSQGLLLKQLVISRLRHTPN